MFAVLLVVFSVALTIACGSETEPVYDQSEILPSYEDTEAVNHIGERATVCGEVHGVTQRAGQATYLTFGSSYPNQVFAVIMEEKDRSNFPADLTNAYGGKKVCASGLVEGKGRSAEMTVRTAPEFTLQP